ncbi:WD repeat-containing protein on Y chromosome-like [Patella vulgata]|uniref:WD repeat-containing protein on Y chromosome-like n=1 Tax=Patella vulgata TaxID=6465 RepID=UPI00217FFBDA|nr:WD repeat-containing protein on Y chromosome-like [Patella vulgata]
MLTVTKTITDLFIPSTRLKSFGDRAFSVYGPRLWNNLKAVIKCSETIAQFNPEQIAANVKLARLQSIFKDADSDGESGLSMSEFKEALRRTSNKPIDEEEVEKLFMKMDANCDGTLDWEEYVSYNLLEYQEKSQMLEMLKEKPFPKEVKEIQTRHHDNIVRVIYSPHVHKRWTKLDYTNGKYVTVSKDGIVTFWSMELRLNRIHTIPIPPDRATQPWFVEMCCIYNVNMIALASTDRDIAFYDITAKKFVKRYVITGLENCITTMDYWADLESKSQSVLVWGDTEGCCCGIYFEIQRGSGLFGSLPSKQEVAKRISFAELLKGHYPNIKAFRLAGIHDDWVSKMSYIPEIGCFLSCCQSSTTSLYLGDFLKKKSPAYFKVDKGLFAFDYCPKLNIIATGGMDYIVRIWNPYVNNKCIVLLKGHTKPVVHVVLVGKKHQVVSIDKSKTIRVFDLKDQSCLQHLSGRILSLGPFPISTIFFNPGLQHLVLATNNLGLLESREEDERHAEILSHNKPVAQILYNTIFKVVVSACEESVISVWDIETGEKQMQFVNAHTAMEDGFLTPLEITAMCFDPPLRRLLTGARDGSVKVWNFNVGAVLQEFSMPEASMVTGIICTPTKFYITGWFRYVGVYGDGEDIETLKLWPKKHEEDILCMAHLNPNLIATGGYDGTIIVWLRETGHTYCRLNAHKGDKDYTRKEYDNLTKNYEAAIEKMLFLETRNYADKDTAVLVASGAEGWVRFWSVAQGGRLLGQFNAAHKPDSSVNTMVVDSENRYLITADTMGVVKVWDIFNYCIRRRITDDASFSRFKKLTKTFPYLKQFSLDDTLNDEKSEVLLKRPPPVSSNPDETLKEPLILNSFRAHTKAIRDLEYINDRQLIITASADCAIRLWTVCGKYIGTFGERWKQLPKMIKASAIKRTIPKDIRRCGSAKTMRVLNGGKIPYWSKAMATVKQRGFARLKAQFDYLQDKDDLGSLVMKAKEEEETSNILGKAYQRQVRHKMPPILPKILETPNSIAVYHTLPFADLCPIDITQATAHLDEASQKRCMASMKDSHKRDKKGESPIGLVGHYNQVVHKSMGGTKHLTPSNRVRKVVSRHTKASVNTSPEVDDRSTPTSSPIHPLDMSSPQPTTGRNTTKLKFPVIE